MTEAMAATMAGVLEQHEHATAALAGLYAVIDILQAEQHHSHAFDDTLLDLLLAARRLGTVLSSFSSPDNQAPQRKTPLPN